MEIIERIAKQSPCYKANKQISVKGIMIHSVGTPQPSAEPFLKNWSDPNYDKACVHAIIDSTDKVYQVLPWNWRAWHCGGNGNNTHISVEMTEPNTIKYLHGSTWSETADGKNTKAHVMSTYNTAVELFASLCKEYKLDPLKDGVVISHSEGHKRGIASNHADVEHIWTKLGLSMNQFRKDINEKMNEKVVAEPTVVTPVEKNTELFRVQTGAYRVKENAEKLIAELKADKIDAFLIHDTLYKVQVGAFSIEQGAKDYAKKLKKMGYDTYITGGNSTVVPEKVAKKSNTVIAQEVIGGLWGNGVARTQKLADSGYNAEKVQDEVNKLLSGSKVKAPTKKSNTEIAKEVIKGLWGNGTARSSKLKVAGYDPTEIQKIVNKLL